MSKYLLLNGKRMSKAEMCNILNGLNEVYFEPIDYDYKLMVDVFVRWMSSLSRSRRFLALSYIYKNVKCIEMCTRYFNEDVMSYYGK